MTIIHFFLDVTHPIDRISQCMNDLINQIKLVCKKMIADVNQCEKLFGLSSKHVRNLLEDFPIRLLVVVSKKRNQT